MSEGWGGYKGSQERLYDLILPLISQKNKNIVLISGDIHMGEIIEVTCVDTNNYNNIVKINEITSSGLTHALKGVLYISYIFFVFFVLFVCFLYSFCYFLSFQTLTISDIEIVP